MTCYKYTSNLISKLHQEQLRHSVAESYIDEWCLLKQFHKYMKYIWPRKHTEKHGKINGLTGNGFVSFRVFPWRGS